MLTLTDLATLEIAKPDTTDKIAELKCRHNPDNTELMMRHFMLSARKGDNEDTGIGLSVLTRRFRGGIFHYSSYAVLAALRLTRSAGRHKLVDDRGGLEGLDFASWGITATGGVKLEGRFCA